MIDNNYCIDPNFHISASLEVMEVCLFASEFTQALCSSRLWRIQSYHHSHQGDVVCQALLSAFAELHLWGISFLRLIAAPADGGLALPQKRVRLGGMTHCPALIYKRPTSMTHNPVSHHVETRYGHDLSLWGSVSSLRIIAKDREGLFVSHFDGKWRRKSCDTFFCCFFLEFETPIVCRIWSPFRF